MNLPGTFHIQTTDEPHFVGTENKKGSGGWYIKEADLGYNLNDFGNKRKEKVEFCRENTSIWTLLGICFVVAKCMHI